VLRRLRLWVVEEHRRLKRRGRQDLQDLLKAGAARPCQMAAHGAHANAQGYCGAVQLKQKGREGVQRAPDASALWRHGLRLPAAQRAGALGSEHARAAAQRRCRTLPLRLCVPRARRRGRAVSSFVYSRLAQQELTVLLHGVLCYHQRRVVAHGLAQPSSTEQRCYQVARRYNSAAQGRGTCLSSCVILNYGVVPLALCTVTDLAEARHSCNECTGEESRTSRAGGRACRSRYAACAVACRQRTPYASSAGWRLCSPRGARSRPRRPARPLRRPTVEPCRYDSAARAAGRTSPPGCPCGSWSTAGCWPAHHWSCCSCAWTWRALLARGPAGAAGGAALTRGEHAQVGYAHQQVTSDELVLLLAK